MLKLGFTGTQQGMNDVQHKVLNYFMSGIYHHHFTEVELHMGMCIGADEESALLARNLGWRVIGHPPTDTKKMAQIICDDVLIPLPYLDRNKVIVDSTHLLIAAPNTIKEVLRSGTWSTVRYAKKLQKPIIYIFP